MMKVHDEIECNFCHGRIKKAHIEDKHLNVDICDDKRCNNRYKQLIKEALEHDSEFLRYCLDKYIFDWAYINDSYYIKQLESMGMHKMSTKEVVNLLTSLYIKELKENKN